MLRPRGVSTAGAPSSDAALLGGALDRNGSLLERLLHYPFPGQATRVSLGREDQAVRQHGHRDGLDVVRLEEPPSARECARLRDPEQGDARTRARAQIQT